MKTHFHPLPHEARIAYGTFGADGPAFSSQFPGRGGRGREGGSWRQGPGSGDSPVDKTECSRLPSNRHLFLPDRRWLPMQLPCGPRRALNANEAPVRGQPTARGAGRRRGPSPCADQRRQWVGTDMTGAVAPVAVVCHVARPWDMGAWIRRGQLNRDSGAHRYASTLGRGAGGQGAVPEHCVPLRMASAPSQRPPPPARGRQCEGNRHVQPPLPPPPPSSTSVPVSQHVYPPVACLPWFGVDRHTGLPALRERRRRGGEGTLAPRPSPPQTALKGHCVILRSQAKPIAS